ncbi:MULTISPECIES: hypothetical protein [unclassified Sutcliffiella]
MHDEKGIVPSNPVVEGTIPFCLDLKTPLWISILGYVRIAERKG